MQVFARIIGYILVTSSLLADLMRYPLAGKLCISDLSWTMCSCSSEKSDSEEVRLLKTLLWSKIFTSKPLIWWFTTQGVINMFLSFSSVLFYPRVLLPSPRQYSPISIFQTFLYGKGSLHSLLLLLLFFFPNGKTTSTGTSSDNKILRANPSAYVNMLPQKWSILTTASKGQKSFSVITYFWSLENTFDSLLTLERYHFVEGSLLAVIGQLEISLGQV